MNWIQRNFKTLIYVAFLVPILTVAFVSISHVAKWYGLSNPISWAIYLSVGIEIAALSALAAISAQMGRKVYFPFAIVTLIQFIGNIFFAYQYIDIGSQSFKDWIDLVDPLVSFMGVESGDIVGHKRFLALFAGGMLPIISLSFLHMLVKFEEDEKTKKKDDLKLSEASSEEPTKEINIDEISIAAGKEEAKYVQEKYTPTEEELLLLEKTLRQLNESKFKALEEPEEEPQIETPVEEEVQETEPEENFVSIPVEIESEPIEVENPIETPQEDISINDEFKITAQVIKTPEPERPINRLTYSNRNASNVSVQRI